MARESRREDALHRAWREHFNRVRPHSALGYHLPAPEAIAAGPPSASLRAFQQRLPDRMTTA
jgi:transposase InsO family protein